MDAGGSASGGRETSMRCGETQGTVPETESWSKQEGWGAHAQVRGWPKGHTTTRLRNREGRAVRTATGQFSK